MGTYCTGTVRTNRKNFPNALKPEKKHPMGPFRFATARKAKLTAAWWRDRRDVYVMSTMHNISASTVLKRPKGEREKKPILCPTAIIDYNKWMGGVNLRASPQSPEYLQSIRGRRPATPETRLSGKHFPYKVSKRGRCAVCSKQVSQVSGKRKDTKLLSEM